MSPEQKRERQRALASAWKKANPDRVREQRQRWKAGDREKVLASKRERNRRIRAGEPSRAVKSKRPRLHPLLCHRCGNKCNVKAKGWPVWFGVP